MNHSQSLHLIIILRKGGEGGGEENPSTPFRTEVTPALEPNGRGACGRLSSFLTASRGIVCVRRSEDKLDEENRCK